MSGMAGGEFPHPPDGVGPDRTGEAEVGSWVSMLRFLDLPAHLPSLQRSASVVIAAALLSSAPAAAQVDGASAPSGERRILVSLQEARLWLLEGADTLLSAPVAIGRAEVFRYGGREYDWRTPPGVRAVLAKRPDPVWTVPTWHYYERAVTEGLRLVEMAPDRRYPLADGSHLAVRGRDVVRVLDGRFYRVPQGREIVIDGVLYVPPGGTLQREVRGALGTHALDLGDGYLIHGTHEGNRSSIGTAASHGCIRMRNPDIERLFELAGVGTRVEIF